MSYLLLGGLSIASVVKKNSIWIFGALFAFLVIMFGANYDNADYGAYVGIYSNASGYTIEPLSKWIFNFAFNTGLPFQWFFALWGLTGLALIASTIYKYSPYPTFVLAMYALWPFAIDVVHMRFFMAYSVIFFGLRYIVEYHTTHEKINILKFLALVVIGTGFHFSVVFFASFVLLFIDFEQYKKWIMIVFPAVIILSIAAASTLATVFANTFIGIRIGSWLIGRTPTHAFVLKMIITRGGALALGVIMYFVTEKFGNKDEIEDEEKTIDRCFFCFMYYGMLMVMLELVYDSVYERMLRLGLIAMYIYVSRKLSLLEGKWKTIMTIVIVAYSLGCFVIYMATYGASIGAPYFTNVFRRLFDSNYIIPGL